MKLNFCELCEQKLRTKEDDSYLYCEMCNVQKKEWKKLRDKLGGK